MVTDSIADHCFGLPNASPGDEKLQGGGRMNPRFPDDLKAFKNWVRTHLELLRPSSLF
jgi:hypothetical protein